MENNTLISHELEEMRAQINILKDKLEKQNIVNEKHIRNSMVLKANNLNNTVRGTVIGGIFALIYCPICFSHLGCSLPFVIATTIMLAVCLALTILQKVALGKMDFSQGSLVETAKTLGSVKKHYIQWTRFVAPVLISLWYAWCMYELIKLDKSGGIVILVFATIGGIIGGIIGFSINRKVITQANEILSQIKDLQKGE